MRSSPAVLIAVLALIGAPAVASTVPASTPHTGPLPVAGPSAVRAASGVTALGGSPGNPIVNPKTHTLYVALQCTDSTCSHPEHVLDVINTNDCKPGTSCHVIAKAAAGKSPLAEAIDFKTDTIYVGDAGGTVTVVDGARCNAVVTSGCGKPLATIKTGGFVVALAFNPKTRTVYAASLSGAVFVIDAIRCSTVTTKGCGKAVKKVKDPLVPDGIALDVATDTVYAANTGPTGKGHTLSVINGAICNGSNGSGCGQTPHTVKVGSNPFWDVVDQATNTIYVANNNDGTVSVINGATCNAKVTAGCKALPPTVPTGTNPEFLAVDDSLHTVFAINQGDDTLSVINTKTCNGKVTYGCRKRARNERATFNPPVGYNPNAFALVPQSGTAYLVNVGGEAFLGAVSISHCNAVQHSGCRVEAPTVRDHEYLLSIDRATHTIYAGNLHRARIDVLNGATCNVKNLSGCKPVAEIPMPHLQANVGAIDDVTHTLYASDPLGNTISVINIAHCKATNTTGCAAAAPKLTVGPGPGPPVLNRSTHTLYAPNGPKSNQVAVLNAATCNATNTAGCGQAPAQVPVGDGTYLIALSAAKDTVYAASSGLGFATLGHTVAVINGATCNGTDHSGCGHVAATAKVGLAPFGVAVNDKTHTVYVSNNANGDLPGTVSLIDSATCNGSHTAGCTGVKPTAAVGHSPGNVAVDAATDTVYVVDFASAAVSLVNGSACRAGQTSGCSAAMRQQPVGSSPSDVAINEATDSVYVPDGLGPGSLSIFKTSP